MTGRVVNALNGQPVKKAAVQLARGVERGPRSAPASVLTNAEGVFRFEGVPPGAYRLSASRTGFVRGLYLNEARTYTLTVGEGAVANLRIALTPAAVVAGKVLDQDGDPIEAATVQVLRATYADGKRNWGVIQSTNTNDLGEYRIAGVAPGRYLIGVSKRAPPAVRSANVPMPPPGGMGRGGPGGFGVGPMGVGPMAGMGRGGQPVPLNDHQFVPVYFPSALDPASATTLDCKPGAELRNIDFRLRKTRVFRVSGIVKGGPPAVSSGQPRRGPGVAVSLYSNAAAGEEGQRNAAVTREGEGAFEFAGIMPGSYTLVAFEIGRNTTPMFARIPVEVNGEDVTGLLAALQPAAKISGRLVFEGAAGRGRRERMGMQVRANKDARGAFAGSERVNGMAARDYFDATARARPLPGPGAADAGRILPEGRAFRRAERVGIGPPGGSVGHGADRSCAGGGRGNDFGNRSRRRGQAAAASGGHFGSGVRQRERRLPLCQRQRIRRVPDRRAAPGRLQEPRLGTVGARRASGPGVHATVRAGGVGVAVGGRGARIGATGRNSGRGGCDAGA